MNFSKNNGENKRLRGKKEDGLPDVGGAVWVEEEEQVMSWIVQSRKDKNINCKNYLTGERKSINFNKVRWGYLEEPPDLASGPGLPEFSAINSVEQTNLSLNTFETPPTRASTPVEFYEQTPGDPLKPPVLNPGRVYENFPPL